MKKNAKIYVAGHKGMVGSAIVRELERQGYRNIVTRTHSELDLTRQEAVEAFFDVEKPEYVFHSAGKVGGIIANNEHPSDFMYENMMMEMNVIHAAWKSGVKKLEFLGSSCIYPRLAPQPMPESCLLTSELEQTNEAYGQGVPYESFVKQFSATQKELSFSPYYDFNPKSYFEVGCGSGALLFHIQQTYGTEIQVGGWITRIVWWMQLKELFMIRLNYIAPRQLKSMNP